MTHEIARELPQVIAPCGPGPAARPALVGPYGGGTSHQGLGQAAGMKTEGIGVVTVSSFDAIMAA